MTILHVLNNGLRIAIDPLLNYETIALGVWANAGSVDETDAEHGIAHLLEHMAFKGTNTRSARQIALEMESVGGYINAATSHQRTGYYVRLLKSELSLGVEMLADILRNPLMSEDELEKEKEVVVQEIGEAADLPDDVVFENLQSLSWGAHPLARPILGTPSSVRAQSVDSLTGFMKRHYVPDNMAVAISGGVDPDDVIKKIDEAFGDMAMGEPVARRSAPIFVGGHRHDGRSLEQSHLAIAAPGVASNDRSYFATRLFSEILGGGMSSRLFQKVREERGLVYSIYAFADGYDDNGLFGIYAGADAADLKEVTTIVRSELAAMASDVHQEEVDRARAMIKSSLMMALESPAARIESAAGQLFTYGELMPTEEIEKRLNDVTPDDICRCAEKALAGPFAISIVGDGNVADVENALLGSA